MYTSIDEIVAWSRSRKDRRRPLILCEYSHAMGNSNGSLADYFAAFEKERGLQGGFVWEWVDHGIRRTHADGRVETRVERLPPGTGRRLPVSAAGAA